MNNLLKFTKFILLLNNKNVDILELINCSELQKLMELLN